MDAVQNPPHYTKHPIQPIDFITSQEMTYCAGAATKYICRYRYKGSPVEDLEKAIQYLRFEIQRLQADGDKHL